MSGPADEFGKSLARELDPAERDRILDRLGQGYAPKFERGLNAEAIRQALDFYMRADGFGADDHWKMVFHPSPDMRERMVWHIVKLALDGDAAASEFLLNLSLRCLAENIDPPAPLREAARAFLSG